MAFGYTIELSAKPGEYLAPEAVQYLLDVQDELNRLHGISPEIFKRLYNYYDIGFAIIDNRKDETPPGIAAPQTQRRDCKKRAVGDQWVCHECGLVWDMGDDDPPACNPS